MTIIHLNFNKAWYSILYYRLYTCQWPNNDFFIVYDSFGFCKFPQTLQKNSLLISLFFLFTFRFSRYHFQLKPYNPDHKAPGSKDLVYLEPSPGFCTKNQRLGIQGTSGRQCNNTSIGVDGCDLMCCGRGYRTQEVIVVERCSCTFHWCCEVKCKLCRTKKTIHTCL